jgi:hypothetical protein
MREEAYKIVSQNVIPVNDLNPLGVRPKKVARIKKDVEESGQGTSGH